MGPKTSSGEPTTPCKKPARVFISPATSERSPFNGEEAGLAHFSRENCRHLCADSGVVVTAYVDHAEGTMEQTPDGGGHFLSATLRPRVTIAAGSDPAKAGELHHLAHAQCFIAGSVNFPVHCEPEIAVA
jgi:hypothetical protein